MLNMLLKAAEIALPNDNNDARNFWLGCVGIRQDGAIVCSKNGSVKFSTSIENYQLMPSSHAEGRVLRKLGKCGIVFVSRVAKKDGSLTLARPCPMCQVRLRAFQVQKVFYTINQTQYGVWFPESDKDKIYTIKDSYVS